MKSRLAVLTRRQRQVLALMAKGLENEEIGRRLHLSYSTTRQHANRIYKRLGIEHAPGINQRVTAVLVYLDEE